MWHQIIPTWSIIEAKCALPATIAVVGADERDDVVSVGRSLAAAAVASGRSAGLFLLDPAEAESSGDGFDVIALDSANRKVFDDRRTLLLNRYDILIIVVPQALRHPLGPHAMRASAAVIVALSMSRGIGAADRALRNLLGQLGSSTIGVVRTATASRPNPPKLSSLRTLRKTLRALVFRT